MVMGSILGDAPVPYSPDDDEDQLDPLKNQPLPPPPPPQANPVNTGEVPFAAGQTPPVYGPPVPPPPQTGDPFIDAPTGSPRAQLEANRQGDSQYGSAAAALGTALPLIGFGPIAGAASLGLQSAAQDLPGPLPEVAQLAPYFLGEGNLATGLTRAAGAGTGLYGGQQLDQALGTPNLPLVGGPFGLAGMTAGGFTPEIGNSGAAQNIFHASMPEPNVSGANFGAGLPIDPLNHGIPDIGQGPLMAGGEPNAPGGRLYTPENEPYGYHAPNELQARAQQAYDAAYAATPFEPGIKGEPNVSRTGNKELNAEAARQEVLSGQPLPGNYSAIPQEGVMPNRNGTPLAYDPTFSSGSGYRETIAPPTGVVAPYVPPREPEITLGRELRGNAETAAMQQPFSHEVGALPPELLQNELDATNRIISQNLTPYETEPHRIEMWNSITDQQRAGITQQYNEAIDRRSQLTAEMERRGMSPQMTEGLYRPIGGVESGRMPPEEVAQQLSQRLEGGGLPEASSSVSPPPPSQLTPAEQAGAAGLTGDARVKAMEDFGNTPQARALSPEAQEFLNSPSGRAATAQRDALINTGLRPSETTTAATGGVPPTRTTGGGATGGGGGGVPPTGPAPKGINPNLWQQGMSAISAPTRVLLGFFPHSLRIGVQEIPTHAGAFVNAVKGMAEIYRTGKAPLADAVNHSFTGTNGILQNKGVLLSDMEAKFHPPATQYVNPTLAEKGLSLIPGLDRASKANFGYLNLFRDGIYNQAADFLARTTPNADKAMFEDLYLRASHGTGHSTLPGLRGNSTLGAAGLGPSALAARLQNTLDIFVKSGAPTPFSAGARGEAMRSLMGTAGVMALTSAVGYKLGAEVNLPFNLGPIKASDITNQNGLDSKLFKAVSTTPDLANKTVYGGGGGYDTLFRLFGNVGIDAMNGDHKALEGHVTSFLRGQAGVVPSIALDLLLGENWRGTPYGPRGGDKGMENFKGDLGQGFVNHWGPIAVKSLVDAYNAWGPGGLLRAAPSLGAYEVQTSPTTTTDQRNAVKDDARVPEAIRGVNPQELGPRGKDALDQVLKQDYPAAQQQAQANQKENENPAVTKYHDTIEQANHEESQRKDALLDAMRSGQLSGADARQAKEIIESAANARRDGARNDPAYKDAVKDFTSNDVNKALNVFYAIQDNTPRAANGKPDYTAAQTKQYEFLKYMEQNDPKTAKLLMYEIDTHKAKDNALDQIYQLAQPTLSHYFGDLKGQSVQQQNERRGNPRDDALLNLLGYESKTLTPQAAQILQQMRATLPSGNTPATVGARGQGVAAPAEAAAAPAQPAQAPAQPVQTGAAIGPNGRSVAQIAGNPYLSDEERNFYFQSRGLPVPAAGQSNPAQINPSSGGATGSAYTTNAQGRTPPINGADIAPVAQKYGVPAGPFALLMNHEGNGAHDTSEKGVQPARWGIVETTAKQYGISDTRTMTPQQAYDIAGQYLNKGMEANHGDAAKAFASYYIGQGNVEKAVRQGGDWVANADRIAGGVGDQIGVNYGGHSMSDFLSYLGLR